MSSWWREKIEVTLELGQATGFTSCYLCSDLVTWELISVFSYMLFVEGILTVPVCIQILYSTVFCSDVNTNALFCCNHFVHGFNAKDSNVAPSDLLCI